MSFLLEYVRMTSYAITIISCVFSLIRGIKNIKWILISNIIFAILLLTSVIFKSLFHGESGIISNYLLTPGVIIWAGLNWWNFIKKS